MSAACTLAKNLDVPARQFQGNGVKAVAQLKVTGALFVKPIVINIERAVSSQIPPA